MLVTSRAAMSLEICVEHNNHFIRGVFWKATWFSSPGTELGEEHFSFAQFVFLESELNS